MAENSVKKILLLLLLIATPIRAEIIEINHLSEVRDQILTLQKKYAPQQILAILEVQNVILTPSSPMLNPGEEFRPLINKALKGLSRSKMIYINEFILTNFQHELSDPDLLQYLKDIQAPGTPLIAINKYLTGNFNDIERLEVWLSDYLKKFNIDFNSNFPQYSDLTLTELHNFQGFYPVFYHGILNCNNNKNINSKFQVLASFLARTNFFPQILIMVDSDISILKGAEEQMKSLNDKISFIGYHYLGRNQAIPPPVNQQEFIRFWLQLVDKLNKVKRTNPAKKIANPYE